LSTKVLSLDFCSKGEISYPLTLYSKGEIEKVSFTWGRNTKGGERDIRINSKVEQAYEANVLPKGRT